MKPFRITCCPLTNVQALQTLVGDGPDYGCSENLDLAIECTTENELRKCLELLDSIQLNSLDILRVFATETAEQARIIFMRCCQNRQAWGQIAAVLTEQERPSGIKNYRDTILAGPACMLIQCDFISGLMDGFDLRAGGLTQNGRALLRYIEHPGYFRKLLETPLTLNTLKEIGREAQSMGFGS